MEEKHFNEEHESEPWYKGPIKYIIMLFLLLIVVLWIFPAYSVKLDPEPKYIPSIKEVVPETKLGNSSNTLNDLLKIIYPNDPAIKQIANKISVTSCDGNKICQAKALYYFVRDKYNYVSDPIDNEYIEDPKEFLSIGGGDCESGSIALAVLEEAIGIDAQLVLIKGHAYIRIKLPEALRRYKLDQDWVYLDWTCKTCGFGEIPFRNLKNKEVYLEIS